MSDLSTPSGQLQRVVKQNTIFDATKVRWSLLLEAESGGRSNSDEYLRQILFGINRSKLDQVIANWNGIFNVVNTSNWPVDGQPFVQNPTPDVRSVKQLVSLGIMSITEEGGALCIGGGGDAGASLISDLPITAPILSDSLSILTLSFPEALMTQQSQVINIGSLAREGQISVKNNSPIPQKVVFQSAFPIDPLKMGETLYELICWIPSGYQLSAIGYFTGDLKSLWVGLSQFQRQFLPVISFIDDLDLDGHLMGEEIVPNIINVDVSLLYNPLLTDSISIVVKDTEDTHYQFTVLDSARRTVLHTSPKVFSVIMRDIVNDKVSLKIRDVPEGKVITVSAFYIRDGVPTKVAAKSIQLG